MSGNVLHIFSRVPGAVPRNDLDVTSASFETIPFYILELIEKFYVNI